MSGSKKDLATVVRAHIADLRGCAPTLRAHGLAATADEVLKAAGELEAALPRAARPPAPPKRLVQPARAAGGRARAEKLSAERRSEIARFAAQQRWGT